MQIKSLFFPNSIPVKRETSISYNFRNFKLNPNHDISDLRLYKFYIIINPASRLQHANQ